MDVEAAIAEVAKETPGIVSVYLFGSVAEGRSHRESDIDIGVLLDWSLSADERFAIRLRLIGDLSGPNRPDADVVILNDAPPLLARAIIYGRRIYCADAEVDHAFVRDAQIRAADFEPWMKRMWAIKLKALARR